MIDCQTETNGGVAQVLHVGPHTLRADLLPADFGQGSGPGPHDLFDASLAACKALTATWYAKKNGLPLERVETHVERDDREEKSGKYVLKVRVAFHGPLSAEQRAKLYAVVAKCPIHKLMTTTDVIVETAPLDPP